MPLRTKQYKICLNEINLNEFQQLARINFSMKQEFGFAKLFIFEKNMGKLPYKLPPANKLLTKNAL